MPVFHYKAKNKSAATLSGQVEAKDKAEAIEQVSLLGLLPISVTEQDAQGRAHLGHHNFLERKPSAQGVYLFTCQLFNLTKSGIPILRAMEIIALQQKNKAFREVIESVRLSVQQGRSLSDGLAQYSKIFSGLYLAMVKAGEESGNLKEVLGSLAEYQRGQQEISSRVRTALAYPALMLLFGVGTVFFILTYVLPQITKLFDNLEQALPLPTIIVMQISAWLTDPRVVFSLAFGGLLGFWVLQNFFRSQKGRVVAGHLGIKTPLVGPFFLRVDLARFARTLELLLKSGVPIVRGIKLAIPVVDNEIIRQELTNCHDELVAGKTFGDSLQHCGHIPDIVGYLVSVGEESGSLTSTLKDISETYEQEVEERLKVTMTLMEPMMIVFVGGLIGFIIMAMLLPIFQMDILAG